MCTLKALSKTTSFKRFAGTTSIPVYSCHDKGEIVYKSDNSVNEEYRISFDVSEKDWDDFPGQVNDAIVFLEKWGPRIAKFQAKWAPDELFLTFPLWSRLDSKIANQNDYFPGRLVALAGALGIGIEISNYRADTFDAT